MIQFIDAHISHTMTFGHHLCGCGHGFASFSPFSRHCLIAECKRMFPRRPLFRNLVPFYFRFVLFIGLEIVWFRELFGLDDCVV